MYNISQSYYNPFIFIENWVVKILIFFLLLISILEVSKHGKCIYALLTMPKPLTVWITINCGKF